MTNENAPAVRSYLGWANSGRASFWRYTVGIAIAGVLLLLLGGLVLIIPFAMLVPDYGESLSGRLMAMLLTFVVPFAATPLIVWLMHKRPWWSVAMPELRFRLWDFLTGVWVALVVSVLTTVGLSVVGLLPVEGNPEFNIPTLLVVSALGLVGIFIQASAEELFFRGYLTQFVRRFTANKILFLGIPALLFAAPHVLNIASLGGGPLALAPYFVSGLLYGWAAYQSGSLWMAVALHFVNNYTGLVLVGTRGDVLPSAAPLVIESPSLVTGTLAVFLQSLLIFVVLSYLIKRRVETLSQAHQ